MSGEASAREILIATIADLLEGCRTIAVGMASPMPAAGAMLLRARNAARGLPPVRISVLGSRRHNFFTNYPALNVRWPGSFGSAFLYYIVPRVILFREEHSPRVFVDRVDFISAPGVSSGMRRCGGPYALLTGMALFDFDAAHARFRLRSLHGGASARDVKAATGFVYEAAPEVPRTPTPDTGTLALLRGRVRDELAETYPQFAATLAGS